MKFKSDIELWIEIKQGDTAAFEVIYSRYWEKIYTLFYWHLLDQEYAKDLVQELFTDLWMKKGQINISSTFEGYLKIAARNKMLNHIRAYNIRKKHNNVIEKSLAGQKSIVEEVHNEKELRKLHHIEIEKLPIKMKNVYQLVKQEGLSITEVALQLSVSEQTVKNQLVNALKKIRTGLEFYRIS